MRINKSSLESVLVTQLCPTPWTVAHQSPLFMGFPRQEYWRGLPCPSPGDLPDPGMELTSPALVGGFFTTEPLGKPSSKISKTISLWKLEHILPSILWGIQVKGDCLHGHLFLSSLIPDLFSLLTFFSSQSTQRLQSGETGPIFPCCYSSSSFSFVYG